MSDDSFIREVNEEYRSDQAKALWERYGIVVAGLALLIVLGTAGYVGYQYWDESRANASGDKFLAALQLANDGKSDEAITAFDQLEKDGYGAYPVLARMRAATVKANKGDFDGAVKDFDAVAADTAIPSALRDMARLRAGLLLVDHGATARARRSASPPGRTASRPTRSSCSTRSAPTRRRRATCASGRR
jgi:hypothetical protein